MLEKYQLCDSKLKKVKKKAISKMNQACPREFLKKLENVTRRQHISAQAAPKPIWLQPWSNPRMKRTLGTYGYT